MEHKINLREERDFGQKINAVFTFLQQNFNPLFKCLLFIAGPLALVSGFFMGMYQSKVLTAVNNVGLWRGNTQQVFTPSYFLAVSFTYISFAVVFLVVYGYLAEYLEASNKEITPTLVWKRVKQNLLYSILATIGLFIITCIGLLLLAIPGIYIAVAFQLALIIIVMEKVSFFDLISRCFFLIRGKWWSTFGLLLVVGIIQIVLGLVFAIPTYLMTLAGVLHIDFANNNIFIIFGTLFSTIGGTFLYSITALAIAFQYFNLVEKKEGTGLLEEVELLGQTQPVAHNEGDF